MRLLGRSRSPSFVSTLFKTRSATSSWLKWLVAA
jgi:hypothetical protein